MSELVFSHDCFMSAPTKQEHVHYRMGRVCSLLACFENTEQINRSGMSGVYRNRDCQTETPGSLVRAVACFTDGTVKKQQEIEIWAIGYCMPL